MVTFTLSREWTHISARGHDCIKTSPELRTIWRDLRKRNMRNVDKEKRRNSHVCRRCVIKQTYWKLC